jgi:hypothetical protein
MMCEAQHGFAQLARAESDLSDFHELRQEFIPPNQCAQDCPTCGREAVKSVLRLFDELVKCDEEGVLKGVRDAISNPVG